MIRRLLLTAGTSALALPALAGTSAAASTPVPIGHNQLFLGMVNNSLHSATIFTDCASTDGYGHPVPNQTVEVVPTSTPGAPFAVGNTGDGNMVDVLLGGGGITNVLAYLTSYNAPTKIFTGITVPCSGSGTATFIPIPYDPPPGQPSTVNITFTPAP